MDDAIPRNRLGLPETICWKDGELFLLDQTLLPGKVAMERQDSVAQVSESIVALKVRGAPAIGVAGAYGLLVALRDQTALPRNEFLAALDEAAAFLGAARPTAVNLTWGLARMAKTAKASTAPDSAALFADLEKEAIQIHEEDRELCRRIGEHGAELIMEEAGILTHCNAGSLATSEFGTALSPMYVAHRGGVPFRVFADETRPLLQGARLTSWELAQAGIDVTLISDNMAAHMMAEGEINLVIVGTDRVAANGDVANKIGTLGVAILAKHFGIPFYVACPYSTVDFATPTGAGIVIEERAPEEITAFGGRPTAPEGISVRNPAFDVTPHDLVHGFITELGIIRPPFADNLRALQRT